MTTPNEEYSASSLTVLEGLEAVRKRPGMYIGSTDSRGIVVLSYEIIDNAVDEALAGFCTKIDVTMHPDGAVTVIDNGRGIPVDVEPRTGLSGVEVVFTKLHAGGKFGGEGSSYGASGGLHGVGASVTNALSNRLDVEVYRGGQTHAMSFHRGTPGTWSADGKAFTPGQKLRVVGKSKIDGTGTKVTFWPDREIFLADAVIDLDIVHARARQTAFLVPGLEIVVTDARGDKPTTETFKYDGGVTDFVEYLAEDKAINDPIIVSGTGTYEESVPVLENGTMVTKVVPREMGVEIALRWGTGYDSNVKSFVNIVATPKGGTHVAGFERALVKSVNDAIRAHKVIKASEELPIKDDVLEGLTAVVTVKMSEPQFEGQTKEILGTAAASKVVADVVGKHMKELFGNTKQKGTVRPFLDKIAAAAKTRRDLRSRKETIRRKNALETSSLPAKLADCSSTDPELAELLLVEGDSAMGTAKAARNPEFQALLPLRGKILNTMKSTEKQMLDNKECEAIITAMGAGSGRTFDLGSIRYGRLAILTDADVDGAHIRCLLLTLCYRYMRPLLDNGHVYAAVPPLHKIDVIGDKKPIYTYTQEEMEAQVAKLEKAGKRIKEVQRYKGLGEMNADQLEETTLNPATRKLRRMTMEDAEAANAVFDKLMGSDVAPRREFIAENGGLLSADEIDA